MIDDGSTDQSVEIIDTYRADGRVRLLRQANAGVASARNNGIRNARGSLIAFLDQDDIWLPHKLASQVAFIREHPPLGLLHGRQGYIDSHGAPLTLNQEWIEPLSGQCFEALFIKNRIAVLTALVPTGVFNTLGLFKEYLHKVDDYEMWMRIALHYPLGFQDEQLALYRQHATNASNNYLVMRSKSLAANQSILEEFPAARSKLGARIVNDVLFRHFMALGKTSLWPHRDHTAARGYLWKALKLRPWDRQTAALLARALVAPVNNRCAWYWRRAQATWRGERR